MKKLFILLLLLITPFLIAQETIVLNTPYDKEVSITIPETEQGKIDLIKDISEMYWEERYDHEQTLKREKELLDINEQMKKNIVNPLMSQLEKNKRAIDEIVKEKVKIKSLQLGIFFQTAMIFNEGKLSPAFYGMPYLQIFETVNVGLLIGYPFQMGIGLGMKF
jgi:hypothetical protein